MNRASLHLCLIAGALCAAAATAQAQPAPPAGAICVSIDPSRDTLTVDERVAARALVLQAFEAEKLPVDGSNAACAEVYAVTNIKLGNTINVTISGPRGQRTGRATRLDDLPNVYSQMVKSLVTGAPMETGGGSTDRTNVTRDQAAPRRVAADNLKYISLGYGGVVAGRFAYGPAFGGGYRKELDRIGLDLAINFLLANDTDTSDGVTMAIPRLGIVFYQEPLADSTLYYGAGLSYGFAVAGDGDEIFAGSGMQLHAIGGYEAFRSSTLRGFVQLEANFPLYKSESSETDERRYTPSIAVTVGIGWGKSNTTRVVND